MVGIDKLINPKPFISKEHILKHIESIDIYRTYIGKDFKINQAFSSPFRKDNIPSFAIYEKTGMGIKPENQFLYNDFVLGGGDCFLFVKNLFNYVNWFDVYSRIAVDFQIDDKYTVATGMARLRNIEEVRGYKPEIKNNNLIIKVKVRPIENHDIKFWESYGVTVELLNKYRVYPISNIFLISGIDRKETILRADKYAYAFQEQKDGKFTYKIYQPFSKFKWMTNHDNSVWQGWEQLPKEGMYLFITKSLKDVMAIRATNLGIPAVSLQAEKVKPKNEIIEQLKKRFDNIYVLYDNDFDKEKNWGQIFAKEICDTHGLHNLCIPDKYESKDFSDLVKNHGMSIAKNVLDDLVQYDIYKRFIEIPF